MRSPKAQAIIDEMNELHKQYAIHNQELHGLLREGKKSTDQEVIEAHHKQYEVQQQINKLCVKYRKLRKAEETAKGV